jgi:hypothetical protein
MSDLVKGKFKFAKGGREWLLLLLSLLLAFFIWSVHNLSLRYSVYLQYHLEVKSNMEGRALESESEDLLIMRVNATGFYILQHRFLKQSLISISLEPKFLHKNENDPNTFIVYSNEIRDKIEFDLGNDVNIEYFTTESLAFLFPQINCRKVAVAARMEIGYRSQYMPTGRVYLRPDSVMIYGEDKYISNVDSVFTKIITKRRVRRSFQGMTEIIPSNRVRVSQEEIYYKQDVDRYIERSIEVPVKVINVPHDEIMIVLPSKITLTFRQSFNSRREYSEDDFVYIADYNDFLNSIDSKIVPKANILPKNIYSVSFVPPFVEAVYINEKK